MRQADVAIRLRQPTQPDLIQRRLFTVHMHVFAAPAYLTRFGTPARARGTRQAPPSSCLAAALCRRICRTGDGCWKSAATGKGPRAPHLTVNNVLGVLRACQRGLGVAVLPDYLVEENGGLVQLFGEADTLALDAYFVYPEELKSVARIQVFRDFLAANAQRWHF